MNEQYVICSRCLYDTTIPDIRFDENGVCNFCHIHDELDRMYPLNEHGKTLLENMIARIKQHGKNKRYDCIIGVSGGRDSTYTIYKAVQLGLRPLAVHFDNGWNSEIAVNNIYKSTNKYNIDLETKVADWEEFKDLQISFLEASVSDAEIPTDVAIHAVLHDVAAKEKIKYILLGHSFRTEGIVPRGWTYMDGRYLNDVHKKFGHTKITSFPNMTLSTFFYYYVIKQIQVIPFLNYFPYDKKIAGKELEAEMDWVDYGGHHHENVYAKFFHFYFLMNKFNIDKRKLALSARIRSAQMTREAALEEIAGEIYDDMDMVDYTIKKLGLSKEEFENIMNKPVKSYHDYATYYPLFQFFRLPMTLGLKLGIVPKILYYKYIA